MQSEILTPNRLVALKAEHHHCTQAKSASRPSCLAVAQYCFHDNISCHVVISQVKHMLVKQAQMIRLAIAALDRGGACACRELNRLLRRDVQLLVKQSRPNAPMATRNLYLQARPVEVYPVVYALLPGYGLQFSAS